MIGRESLNADQKQSDMMEQLEKIVERMAKWDDTRQALFLLDTQNKVLKTKLARMEDRYERLCKKYFEGKEKYEELYESYTDLVRRAEKTLDTIEDEYEAISEKVRDFEDLLADEGSNLVGNVYDPDEWNISDPSEEEDEEEDESTSTE